MLYKSFAKINLFLEVIGKKANGYHQIRSIFSEIDLSDVMDFEENNDIIVNCQNEDINPKDNLVYKICLFMQEKFCPNKGIKIDLQKNIPIAAGLGGGSSNAATTIMALNKIWDLSLSLKEQNEIASIFGSDINFFLYGNTALGEDRGNKIVPLDYFEIDNILLINSGQKIPSFEAYALCMEYGQNHNYEKFLQTKNLAYSYNALEKGIANKYFSIKEDIQKLISFKAQNSILSGSGATIIGFFETKEDLIKAKNYFDEKKYWTLYTKTQRRI